MISKPLLGHTSKTAVRRVSRSGQTMLELLAATAIMSAALVPALKFTGRCVTNLDAIEKSELCLALCTSTMEAELASTSSTWDLADSRGDFASEGHPNVLVTVTKSDASEDGGRPNALAVISVVVWHDKDGNGNLDTGEPKSQLATKIAKVISYEHESTLN